MTNKEIAGHLGISHRTVANILSLVYDKIGIRSRLELERL
jgi:DNA-binding CsgD family transcriptional regulator